MNNLLRGIGVSLVLIHAASAYTKYGTLVTDHTQVGSADLTDKDVTIFLSDASLKTVGNGGSVVSSVGNDILIASSLAPSAMDCKLESYDGTAGTAVLHARVHALSHTADVTFYVLYGDVTAAATPQCSASGVWDTNYVAVYMLGNGTTLDVSDATGNGHNGTAHNSPTACAGTVDGGMCSTRSGGAYVDLGNLPYVNMSTGGYSMSLWVYINALPTSGASWATAGHDENFNDWGAIYINSSGKLRVFAVGNSGTLYSYDGTGSTTLSINTWYHLAFVFDSTSLRGYVNGVLDNTVATGEAGVDIGITAHSYILNTQFSGSAGSDVIIDQVMFHGIARTAGWLLASYNAEKPSSTFITATLNQSVGTFSVSEVLHTESNIVLNIVGHNGDCTIEVSESPTYSPVVDDVDGTAHSGANTCSGRPDTLTNPNGSFTVTIGHRVGNRALTPATAQYIRVTSGGAITKTITTDTIGIGNSFPWPLPWDGAKHWRRGVDITEAALVSKTAIHDPIHGIKMYPVTSTELSGQEGPFSFVYWSGGSSWTNPGNAINGANSTAHTTNTNPLDIYIGPESDPNFYAYVVSTWTDLGILVYGCGLDATAGNRTITIGLFQNPVTGTIGTPFNVVLPQCAGGSPPSTPMAQVNSSSSDSDHPWPNSYPSSWGTGWGSVYIRPEDRPTYKRSVGASVTTGAVSVIAADLFQAFSYSLEAGNKLFIAGTSCATSPYCTIATNVNFQNVTITDATVTGVSGANWVALRSGIRIAKTNATSTVYLGVQYKIAETRNANQNNGAGPGVQANSLSFTSGDGKPGHLAIVNGGVSGLRYWYFLPNDGPGRLLGIGGRPYCGTFPGTDYFTTGSSCGHAGLGWNAIDIPDDSTILLRCQTAPSTTNARDFYLECNTQSMASRNYYKVHYRGTASTGIDLAYSTTPDHFGQFPVDGEDDEFDWTLVSTSTNNLTTELAAHAADYPTYDSSKFGTTRSFTMRGATDSNLYLVNVLSGGQDTPGWAAVVNVTSGFNLVNLISSYDGTGSKGVGRGGTVHAIPTEVYPSDTLLFSSNGITGNSSPYYTGPFTATINAIMKSGVWNANTSLPWPPDSSYDNTCPGNTWGATTPNCVKIRVTSNNWTDASPGAGESPLAITQGDGFSDSGQGFPFDSESFRVITTPVSEGGGNYSFYAQRNSKTSYCCVTGTAPACVGSSGQATHSNGWTGLFAAQYNQGCVSHTYYVSGGAESGATITEVPRHLDGHTDLVRGTLPGAAAFVSSTGSAQGPLATLFSDSTPQFTLNPPIFAGVSSPVGGGLQSYTGSPGGVAWMSDTNAIAANSPTQSEGFAQVLNGTHTVTATSCTNVYLITPIGSVDYKHVPLRGAAGPWNLGEVSSPTVDLCSGGVPNYTFAYALANGEAYSGTIMGTGSVAGEIYIKVPQMLDPGYCVAGIHWGNTPCIYAAWTGAGWSRQEKWTASDSTGSNNRLLTTSAEPVGGMYSYSQFIALDAASGWTPWTMLNGSLVTNLLMNLPPFTDDGVTRNNYIAKPISVPAGHTYARLKFGRNTSLQCLSYDSQNASGVLTSTGRAEACVTDASVQPFKFLSEAQTAQTCTSGCTVNLPLLPQTVNYYQIQYSSDGSSWSDDSTGIHVVTVGQVTTAADVLASYGHSAAVGASGTVGK